MDLSIIVVSWNTRDRLEACLRSIYENPPPAVFEVLVVDNASTDDSPAMVQTQFPQARLVINPANVGFAVANNQAVRLSQARYVHLLNSDALALPGMFQALFDWMEAHPRSGIAGGTLFNPDGTFQASYGDFPSLLTQLLVVAGLARLFLRPNFPSHGPPIDDTPVRADWVGGACLMVRRAAIEAVGLLDEGFFMYSEEMDWCYRMWQGGWEVHSLPAARCLHWGGQSSQRVQVETPARLASAACRFFAKHHGRLTTTVFRAGVIAAGVVRAALFGLFYLASRARRSDWKEKLAASWRLASAGVSQCASST